MPRHSSSPQADSLARADRLLSRSGQWGGTGIEEERAKEFATNIKKAECLPGIMLEADTPYWLATDLAWIEHEEKFYREWLTVKKLLRKRRERLRLSVKAKTKGRLSNAANLELKEVDKQLAWMRIGPRTPGGLRNPGTRPFLHSRWATLRQMERLLISDYREAVLRGLQQRLDKLTLERINNPTVRIPEWASIKNLQRIAKKEMGRKERAQILACVMALSPLTKMSAGAILRGLQRYYPTN